MSQVVVDITETSTAVTVNQSAVDVAVTETSTSISLGTSGPQGPKGDLDTSAINNHIDDTTPHPAYDDTPSLTLLFENGLI